MFLHPFCLCSGVLQSAVPQPIVPPRTRELTLGIGAGEQNMRCGESRVFGPLMPHAVFAVPETFLTASVRTDEWPLVRRVVTTKSRMSISVQLASGQDQALT